jgi:hypothetical protein
MPSSKKQKVAMVSILIAVLLTAVASFLAQSNQNEPLNSKQVARVFPEKEKEQASRNALAALLSTVGIESGPPLLTLNARSYRELRINWASLQKAEATRLVRAEQFTPDGLLTQTSSIPRNGALPRERSMELSPDHLLVVAVDEQDTARWSKLMIDPRLVRAEVGSSGEMQSEKFYLAKVDFIVECPDDPLLKQLRFFRPVWDGESFHLEPLGSAPVR